MNTLAEWTAWAEERSARTEDGCLVWKKALRDGCPQAGWINPESGRKEALNVRRVLWSVRTGRKPRSSYVVVCGCGTEGCVEPSHLKEISRSQLLGGRVMSADHRLAITKASRARKNIKLSQEAVRDIRYGNEGAQEAADKHGVSKSHVYAIRNHKWCRELSNPFAGLMA